jgi:hypothetical protein
VFATTRAPTTCMEMPHVAPVNRHYSVHTLQEARVWIASCACKLPVNCCCKPLRRCKSCHRAVAALQLPSRVLNLCNMLLQCPPGICRGNRGLQCLVHLQQHTQATVVQPVRAQTPRRARRAASTDYSCNLEAHRQQCTLRMLRHRHAGHPKELPRLANPPKWCPCCFGIASMPMEQGSIQLKALCARTSDLALLPNLAHRAERPRYVD